MLKKGAPWVASRGCYPQVVSQDAFALQALGSGKKAHAELKKLKNSGGLTFARTWPKKNAEARARKVVKAAKYGLRTVFAVG